MKSTNTATVLVFYAFGREMNYFRRRVRQRTPLLGGQLKGFRGYLGDLPVVCVATGIGPERAGRAAAAAFSAMPQVRLAICAGVAGALKEDLRNGDLVVADRLLLAGNNWTAGNAPTIISPPAEWLSWVQETLQIAGLDFRMGTMLSLAYPLIDAASKRRAEAATGAIAVEMESAAIAEQAVARNLPFCCLRTILDEIEDELIGAELSDGEGRLAPVKALHYVLRNPGAVMHLPGMIRSLNGASRALATVLAAVGTALSNGH